MLIKECKILQKPRSNLQPPRLEILEVKLLSKPRQVNKLPLSLRPKNFFEFLLPYQSFDTFDILDIRKLSLKKVLFLYPRNSRFKVLDLTQVIFLIMIKVAKKFFSKSLNLFDFSFSS